MLTNLKRMLVILAITLEIKGIAQDEDLVKVTEPLLLLRKINKPNRPTDRDSCYTIKKVQKKQ
jgi:hypothetical protein